MAEVGIVGTGLMGSGIAQVVAVAGDTVRLYDAEPGQVERARAAVAKRLARETEKGALSEDEGRAALARLVPAAGLDELATAEVVIEAVVEQLEPKRRLFSELSRIVPRETLLATNTSSLSVTAIASQAVHPERVVGMHFFNPVPRMELVEVIAGLETSDETRERAMALARRWGKEPVPAPEAPGFLVNRLLVPMLNEAIYLVMEGARPEDVDRAMKLGAHHPLGPLELADVVGLDTLLYAMEGIYQGFQDPKYRPCPLLRKMVEAGRLGRKSGRGFYTYAV